jgi:hypothetical protein
MAPEHEEQRWKIRQSVATVTQSLDSSLGEMDKMILQYRKLNVHLKQSTLNL